MGSFTCYCSNGVRVGGWVGGGWIRMDTKISTESWLWRNIFFPPLQWRPEPGTFFKWIQRSNHWAIPLSVSVFCFFCSDPLCFLKQIVVLLELLLFYVLACACAGMYVYVCMSLYSQVALPLGIAVIVTDLYSRWETLSHCVSSCCGWKMRWDHFSN